MSTPLPACACRIVSCSWRCFDGRRDSLHFVKRVADGLKDAEAAEKVATQQREAAAKIEAAERKRKAEEREAEAARLRAAGAAVSRRVGQAERLASGVVGAFGESKDRTHAGGAVAARVARAAGSASAAGVLEALTEKQHRYSLEELGVRPQPRSAWDSEDSSTEEEEPEEHPLSGLVAEAQRVLAEKRAKRGLLGADVGQQETESEGEAAEGHW